MDPSIFRALKIEEQFTRPEYPFHDFKDPLIRNFLYTLPPIFILLVPLMMFPLSSIISITVHTTTILIHVWQIGDSGFRRLAMPRLYPSFLRNFLSGQVWQGARAVAGYTQQTGTLPYFVVTYLLAVLVARKAVTSVIRRRLTDSRVIKSLFRGVIMIPAILIAVVGSLRVCSMLMVSIGYRSEWDRSCYPVLAATAIKQLMADIPAPENAHVHMQALRDLIGLEEGSEWTSDDFPLEHTTPPSWRIYPEDTDRPAVLLYLVEGLPGDRAHMLREELASLESSATLSVHFPLALSPGRPTLLSGIGCFQGFLGNLHTTDWPIYHPQSLGRVGGSRVWLASAIDKHLDGSLGYFKKPAAGYDQEKINLRSTFHLPYYANDREALRHTLPLLEEEAFVVGWTRSSHVPVDVPTGEYADIDQDRYDMDRAWRYTLRVFAEEMTAHLMTHGSKPMMVVVAGDHGPFNHPELDALNAADAICTQPNCLRDNDLWMPATVFWFGDADHPAADLLRIPSPHSSPTALLDLVTLARVAADMLPEDRETGRTTWPGRLPGTPGHCAVGIQPLLGAQAWCDDGMVKTNGMESFLCPDVFPTTSKADTDLDLLGMAEYYSWLAQESRLHRNTE